MFTAEHVDSWSTWSLKECLGKQGFWCGNLPFFFFFLPFWGTHFFHLTQPMHYQIFLVFLGGGGGGGTVVLGVWGVGVLIPSDRPTVSQVSREYNIVITQ